MIARLHAFKLAVLVAALAAYGAADFINWMGL